MGILIATILQSCSQEWLEEKQDIKLIIPTTINDYDLLLNANVFQYDGRGTAETSCDDHEFTLEQYNQLSFGFDRDFITWKPERDLQNLQSIQQNEWNVAYNQIQICNVVMNGLSKIERNGINANDYDRIQGTALYFRARQFLNLAMTFCKYYNPNTASEDLGIPLKLDDDIDEPIFRSSLEETYQQIIKDLKIASSLLPTAQPDYTKIAKGGAYGLLARALLFMDKYEAAHNAADSSFKYHSFIEDYNQINGTTTRPLRIQSKEIHIMSSMVKASQAPSIGRIVMELYNQYTDNDLRKSHYFNIQTDGKPQFKGHYTTILYTGTTTAETLLILAETKARLGDKDGAMNSLNLLMTNRFKIGNFIPFVAENATEALDIVLKERRKELVTRGLRWQDLKRLNRDAKYAKTITRVIGSETFTLPPNDTRYIIPIPQFVINFNGIEQNLY